MRSGCGGVVVRIDESAVSARLSFALDVPHDPDFAGLAYEAAKHDLRRGLRPARVGEEKALLDGGLWRVRGDAPSLAVLERQFDALTVGPKLGAHTRMQMEADGVVTGNQVFVRALEALRRGELVLGRDEAAVRRNEDLSRMSYPEALEIAVMRAPDPDVVGVLDLVAERGLRVGRTEQRRVYCRQRAVGAGRAEFAGGDILECQRRMRGRGAGERAPLIVIDRRRAAIDDHRRVAGAHLEGEEACMRRHAERGRRRRADVADEQRRAAFEPRICGVRCIAHRRAFDVVIGEHGGERVGRGGARAVETRQRAVAGPEEAEHRHDALDRVGQLLRRRPIARHETLLERQQVEQKLDERFGVPRDMAAVGKDLALELLAQRPRVSVDHGLLFGDAQPGIDERHQRNEAGHAVRRIAIARREIAELRGERPEEGFVGLRLAGIEHEHRVRQPGDDPATHDLRLPGKTGQRTLGRDEIVDENLGLLARELAAGGAEMSEPTEAMEFARPPFGWWIDLERRLRVDLGEFAGKAEMAVVKLGGKAWVSRPELLRGEQQLLGSRAGVAQARHAGEHDTAERTGPAEAPRVYARTALIGLRISARHRDLSPSCRPALLADARPPRAHAQGATLSGGGRFRSSAILCRGLTAADKAGREKPVHPVPFGGIELELVGEGPEAAGRFDPLRLAVKLSRADGIDAEGGVAGEEGGNLRLAFLRLERASRIDELAAWPYEPRGAVQEAGLERGKRLDVLPRLHVGNVGMAPDGAG